MYKSFIEKKPVGMDTKSVASGLAPPFAGIIQAVSDTRSLHLFKLDSYLVVLFFWLNSPQNYNFSTQLCQECLTLSLISFSSFTIWELLQYVIKWYKILRWKKLFYFCRVLPKNHIAVAAVISPFSLHPRHTALRVVPALCGGDCPHKRRGDQGGGVHPLQVRTRGGAVGLRRIRRHREQQDTWAGGEERGVHPERRQHRERRARQLPRLTNIHDNNVFFLICLLQYDFSFSSCIVHVVLVVKHTVKMKSKKTPVFRFGKQNNFSASFKVI